MRANKNARAAVAGGRIFKCLIYIAYQAGPVKEKRGTARHTRQLPSREGGVIVGRQQKGGKRFAGLT